VDVLGVEELKASTLRNFTNQLNLIYGAGTYAFDPTADLTTGGGTDGLIYNTHTVQVIASRTLKTGQKVFLQSNGVYVAAAASSPSTYASNGITRAPMLYQIRPVGFGTNYDFFIYVSHARAGDNAVGESSRPSSIWSNAAVPGAICRPTFPAGKRCIMCFGNGWPIISGR
jgi:hypothetical protein